MNCQPRGLDVFREQNIVIVGCQRDITVVQDKKKLFSLPIKYESSCVSTNPELLDVAVGGDDRKVHVYTLVGDQLNVKAELEHLGAITDCAYSPNNKYLAACDSNRKVILYSTDEYKVSPIKSYIHIIFIKIFANISQRTSFHTMHTFLTQS